MNYQKKEKEEIMVKSIGIVRKIDGVGRIALPIEFKDSVGVIRNSFVEIAGREDEIVIKKLPACAFCGSDKDLTTFRGKDDVLTLLIHLGYLAYDSEKRTVRIPNEEIRLEFQQSIREVNHHPTLERLKESEQLFLDTIQENENAVSAQIEKIHDEETSPLHYNKEDSLRSVIKLAYYTYRDHYLQFEELPAGKGFADIVYLPKYNSDWPALVIELKWNQSAEGAIEQILDRKYPEALKNYDGDILLAGITYDKDAPIGSRKHSCRIIRYPSNQGTH